MREAQEASRAAWNNRSLIESKAAQDHVLECERALDAAKGESYAVPLVFPARWDIGAPLPHLLQSELRTFLIFLLSNVPEQHIRPTVHNTRELSYVDPHNEQLAVVEFTGCCVAKLGPPNDEVFSGHPLYGRGLDFYSAMTVENSSWIAELERINSVHLNYKASRWRELKHYILAFHDSTFECIARDFKVETCETSLPKLLTEVSQRLFEHD